MPLPNRVSPFGTLFADPARGLFLGNRGGRLHNDDRSLDARRWVSPAWICCRLKFKDRHRDVWGRGYTELFFLDEPTAFAAGHRPCFECRRRDAEAFAALFPSSSQLPSVQTSGRRPRAPDMDRLLHAERLDGRDKRLHWMALDHLPNGVFVTFDGREAFAVCDDRLLRWTPSGYADGRERKPSLTVDVLTPPAMVSVLAAGYRPFWHPSARSIT